MRCWTQVRTEGDFSRVASLKRGLGNDELKKIRYSIMKTLSFKNQWRKLAYYNVKKNKLRGNNGCFEKLYL